ncbi:MAG: N-acetylmuramic acid 6-phosphate etherase [Chloroflexota bacterium]|nr:N-acetylmuramic acid 6-phosphate etherase [Chloroflexota bacterium]
MNTEQVNPKTADIDQLDTLAMVERIHVEDQVAHNAVSAALPQIAAAIDGIVARMRLGGRLFYVGAGTSGRIGVIDAVECMPTYNTPPNLVQGIIAGGTPAFTASIEAVEDDAQAGAGELVSRGLTAIDSVVGIAASGRTPFVVGALVYACGIGACTVGIANNAPSSVLETADHPIALLTGAEVIAGSTRMKAGTAQKLTLNMISTSAMIQLGKVYGNLMVDVQVKNNKLHRRALGLIQQIAQVDETRAQTLLAASGRSVKVAVVMARRDVSADDARALLARADGVLRRVIDVRGGTP